MKKILIAFDGTQFSEGAFEFARRLNDLQPILLTGVFVPQLSYANLWSYAGAMTGPLYIPMIEEEEGVLIQKNVDRFQHACISNDIAFRVHKDYYDFALPELERETRFADLLIISSEKFFQELEGNTGEYLQDLIHNAECPVIVLPETFSFPDKNVITYDGSASSVYAIKQFAYLFPELIKNETMLVYAHNDETGQLPSEDYIEELASTHYKNLNILKLNLKPRKYFKEWLGGESSSIIIAGALGRSVVSRMFNESHIMGVIRGKKLPVFITHK